MASAHSKPGKKKTLHRPLATAKHALERSERRRCPYDSQAGYVAARMIPKSLGGGWAVLYDRKSGPPGWDAKTLPWSEATRWLVIWRGTDPPRKDFKPFASRDEAKTALTALRKGQDACGWFKKLTSKLGVQRLESAASPPARAREAPTTPPASMTLPKPPPVQLGPSAQWKQMLLEDPKAMLDARQVVMEAMHATKLIALDGVQVEVIDWPTRLNAVNQWKEDWGGKAAIEKEQKMLKNLDDSHLSQALLESPAAREELVRLLIICARAPQPRPTAADPDAKESAQEVSARVRLELNTWLEVLSSLDQNPALPAAA